MSRTPVESAFPVYGYSPDTGTVSQAGMTLRQWYAGQALIALIGRGGTRPDENAVARIAHTYADAMLVEGGK